LCYIHSKHGVVISTELIYHNINSTYTIHSFSLFLNRQFSNSMRAIICNDSSKNNFNNIVTELKQMQNNDNFELKHSSILNKTYFELGHYFHFHVLKFHNLV